MKVQVAVAVSLSFVKLKVSLCRREEILEGEEEAILTDRTFYGGT